MKKVIVSIVLFLLMFSAVVCMNSQVIKTVSSGEQHQIKEDIKRDLSGYKVAYASVSDEGGNDIWMADADGANAKKLTSGKGIDMYPEWSSDGKYIYYTSNKHGGTLELYRVNTSGKPYPQQLSNFGKEVRSLSVSASNKLIAMGIMSTQVPFGADLKDFSADLYTLDTEKMNKIVDNGKLVTLEDLKLLLSQPVDRHIWHEQPCFEKANKGDNPWIMYVRTENYDNDPIMKDEIWKVKADGSENQKVAASGSMPQWTFDDKGIVSHEFSVINPTTSEARKLVIDGLAPDAGSPSISPDGKYIIFETSDKYRLAGLALVKHEGTNPYVLFSNRVAYEPRWSPVPLNK